MLAGPALEVNARSFDPPADAPLIAVILEDAGNGSITADAMGLMTMPLTFAIRPDRDGARALAEIVREAGHEVLTELPMVRSSDEGVPRDGELSPNAPPEELEALTLRYLAALDMSVGATTPQGASVLLDQRAFEAVLSPVGDHGFAWLDMKAGIGGTAERIAGEAGIPYAETNRYVTADASEDQIYQMLEGAAFQARRLGTTIVAVSASQDALKAIVRWGLENGGQQVWFAPLSAVIARKSDG